MIALSFLSSSYTIFLKMTKIPSNSRINSRIMTHLPPDYNGKSLGSTLISCLLLISDTYFYHAQEVSDNFYFTDDVTFNLNAWCLFGTPRNDHVIFLL